MSDTNIQRLIGESIKGESAFERMTGVSRGLADSFEKIQHAIREATRRAKLPTVKPHWAVKRGEIYYFDGVPYAHPSTIMWLENNGRTPLWSSSTLGERELQRDRRRHA